MKLSQFLRMKRWTSAVFCREYNIEMPVIRKIINGTGSVSLDTALYIEHVTEGAVSAWDVAYNADAIKHGAWLVLKDKRKHKKEKQDENEKIDPVKTE